ncbi:MAG: molybdenum cofactor biosynthesis protein MoeB, partial [Deltaproteobacteria bacterium]|nr:molybdenum cofactor biosynthesis protein MoeB [Deltaproteobacteria bacterium]
PLALYLAAAGIGKLGLIDFDIVERSNLQRQILHGDEWVGKSKIESAKSRIASLNPEVEVVLYDTRLTSDNAMDIFRGYDVIADGTDNFATRYLTNDACVLLGIPNAYGSIFRFEGQASVFDAATGPCYRCLYPSPPPPGEVPSCAEGGVLGVLPGMIGTIQATETLKIILGQGRTLVGRLLIFNALDMQFRELKLRKSPDCPICSDRATITELIDYEEFCGIGRGDEKEEEDSMEITPREVKELLDRGHPFNLIDVRGEGEYEICKIEGSTLMPLDELKDLLHTLEPADEIVAYCHHGMRSLKALRLMKEMGFTNVKSMAGGIDVWAVEIDTSLPRY